MAQKIINVGTLSHEDWMRERRRGLGGSDAAAVCGVSPHKSSFRVYLEKTGDTVQPDKGEACVIGRDLEDYVALRFEQKTGKRTRRDNFMWCHDKYDFLIADLDRRVIGECAGLECKTASAFSRAEFEAGRVPEHYLMQCYHYMAVMGFERMYLAVLVLGMDFYVFEIERDESKLDALVDTEVDFWYSHVARGVPPSPDGSKCSRRDVEALCSKAERRGGSCDLSRMRGDFDLLSELEGEISALSRRRDAVKQKIELGMAGYAEGACGVWLARRGTREREVVDTAALRKLFPDAYSATVRRTATHTFSVAKCARQRRSNGKKNDKL